MKIAGREIGPGRPVFIVAELSGNHAGRLEHAHALIDAAKEAGADAVKFQVFTPDELTVDSDHPAYVMTDGPWRGRRLWDLYCETRTPLGWLPELFRHARLAGLIPFASVFGEQSLEACEAEDCPAYKIASAEAADLALVERVARTDKPLIVSDGMVNDAMRDVLDIFCATNPMVWLHCVSEYPARTSAYSLAPAGMHDWGISDHTTGIELACAAVALGACVVEKHVRLRGLDYGDRMPADYAFSTERLGFAHYVRAIREVEAALRNTTRRVAGSQWRRRYVFTRALPAGHVITPDDVRTARCRQGIEADAVGIAGWTLGRAVRAGEPATPACFGARVVA